VLRFEVSRSVITVQSETRARFKKDVILVWCVSLCTVIVDLDTSKRRHLGNWSRGPAVSMKSELLVAHEKLGQFPLLTVMLCSCRVRNKFLSAFETAPLMTTSRSSGYCRGNLSQVSLEHKSEAFSLSLLALYGRCLS
jgi:hypothetical protein